MTPRAAGFTLLELLVAMALVLLIGVALMGAIGFGGKMERAGVRANQSEQALLALDNLLRRHLGSAAIDAAPDDEADFFGEADALGFFVDRPSPALPPGLYREIWSLERTDGGMTLYVAIENLTDAGVSPTETEVASLPTGRFRYFGEGANGSLGWFSEWRGSGVPRLIGLALEDGGRPLPLLIARPAQFRERAP